MAIFFNIAYKTINKIPFTLGGDLDILASKFCLCCLNNIAVAQWLERLPREREIEGSRVLE